MAGSASYLILVVPSYPPASFNRPSTPCHPLFCGRGAAGLIGVVGLLTGGVMAPVSAASPRPPSVQSRETRVALLSIFDQLGVGVDQGNDSTRSRANRRHPDVGFISSDPICLSCVMTVLAPPVLPPRQSPPPPVPQPKISSPLLPSAAPKPVPPKPAASKPVTILESRLPAVLTPGQTKIGNPLPPQRTPLLVELSPITIAPQSAPSGSVSEILPAQAPIQTPGPLPILGLGAAFGVSRRLRGRLKAAQRQRVG